MDYKLQKAILELQNQYNVAKKNIYIRNPIAYALYETWKKFDGKYGRGNKND